jgi:hypothetical protein
MKALVFGTSALAALTIAASAQAGTVAIEAAGIGSFMINSGAVPGVFGAESPWFTDDALDLMHNSLHADGVTTDGMVTIVLANTDHGLSLMALVDDNTVGGCPWWHSHLTLESTVESDAAVFINDAGCFGDHWECEDNGDSQTAWGSFWWADERFGDAMAWGGLEEGDEGCFDFSCSFGGGLAPCDPFQFVSWNGSAWEVVAVGDFDLDRCCGEFSFCFTVIPLPQAAGLGLMGLLGVATLRKLRR